MTTEDDTEELELPYKVDGGRGLLTDSEREALKGEKSESYRKQTRMRIHNRIETIKHDLKFIKEHNPEIHSEISGELLSADTEASLSKFESDLDDIKQYQERILRQVQDTDSDEN